jgi:hypothetical protein
MPTMTPIDPVDPPDESGYVSYVTVSEAETYLSDRLYIEPWEDALEANKLKALKMATRSIDSLRFRGDKTEDDQEKEFPRGDNITPQAILDAVVELALALLDDRRPGEEMDDARIKNQGFGGSRTTYETENVPEYIKAGIPSYEAWKLISPYLKNISGIQLNRV